MNPGRLTKAGVTAAPVAVGVLGVIFDATDSWNKHALAAALFAPVILIWFWSIWADFKESSRREIEIERLKRQSFERATEIRGQYRQEIEAVLESQLTYQVQSCLNEEEALSQFPVDHLPWRIDCGHRLRTESDEQYWLTVRGASSGHLPGPEYREVDRADAIPALIEEVLRDTGAQERGRLDVRFFVRFWPDHNPLISNITLCAAISFPAELHWSDRVIIESNVVDRLKSDRLVKLLTHLVAMKWATGEWARLPDLKTGAAEQAEPTTSAFSLGSV